ncbi:hypothetical protein [Echinicola rosea]|uniref:hypothetical protein n=1 Tax=Echinicola rosea TaxID=1807691 RepID=UPI0010CA6973|nr:hypothetical protein [Echinicola rosea]
MRRGVAAGFFGYFVCPEVRETGHAIQLMSNRALQPLARRLGLDQADQSNSPDGAALSRLWY